MKEELRSGECQDSSVNLFAMKKLLSVSGVNPGPMRGVSTLTCFMSIVYWTTLFLNFRLTRHVKSRTGGMRPFTSLSNLRGNTNDRNQHHSSALIARDAIQRNDRAMSTAMERLSTACASTS